ncbi:unnamed protein product [Withania somnifera]
MKNFSSIIIFMFSLCIALSSMTLEAKECRVPLPEAAKPCDPTKCNTQCFDKYQNKPAPPGITGNILGGNCLNDSCFCTFWC